MSEERGMEKRSVDMVRYRKECRQGSVATEEKELRMRAAAQLRVRRKTWTQIAKILGYKSGTCAHEALQRAAPEGFRDLLREAMDEFVGSEVGPEAAKNQMELMQLRKQDDWRMKGISEKAADSVLRYMGQTRPAQLDVRVGRLELQSDAELLERVAARTAALTDAVLEGEGQDGDAD